MQIIPKHIFRKTLLSLLGILIAHISFSQENYQPGYVINLAGDTINGFIDYRNWDKNPDKVAFKSNLNDGITLFTPLEIKEFGTEGEVYVSGIVERESSSTQTQNLKEDPELHIQKDTTFLQTLFEGKRSLYYYKSPDGNYNFYIKQKPDFELLVYKKYLKRNESYRKVDVLENKKYIGQLTLYLSDCATIHKELQNIPYNRRLFEKLFKEYYACTQSKIHFQREREKLSLELGIFVGVSSTSLRFKSEFIDYLNDADFTNSNDFTAGLSLNIILPRTRRKWSINNEFQYASYTAKGRYEFRAHQNSYELTTTEMGLTQFKINTLVRYKHPIGNLHVFFNAGMSNAFGFNETNYKKREVTLHGREALTEDKALGEFRKLEQGVLCGCGLTFKGVFLEARYTIGNGLSLISTLGSSTGRSEILVGYAF